MLRSGAGTTAQPFPLHDHQQLRDGTQIGEDSGKNSELKWGKDLQPGSRLLSHRVTGATQAVVLESVWSVPDCWRDLKCARIFPHCPPPQPPHSGGSVLDTQQVPRRHFLIEWGHWFYTHLYLDLPLFLVRFFLANFCLSG